MDLQTDIHEMQEINIAVQEMCEQPDSLISEMGVTRRRTRTLQTKRLHRRTKDVVDLLPSRQDPLLLSGGGDADTIDGITLSTQAESFTSAVEIRAEQIVQHIEKNKALMEDNPKSEIDRIVALREMTECLTLKRNVKRKLTKSVSSKSKPIGSFKRLKYRTDIFFSKLAVDFKNFLYSFELWYSSLKTIEGHFGSSVASYFKFLRKLFILNVIVFLVITAFVIVPQLLLRLLHVLDDISANNKTLALQDFMTHNEPNVTYDGVYSLPLIRLKSDPYKENDEFRFGNIFTGEGFLTQTVLFYGYYANVSFSLIEGYKYHIPTAYFFSVIFCYFVVFLSLSISMAISYRKSFIETSGSAKNVFANKIFCGWDFGIATKQAAELKSRSIYMELKELLDEQTRKKEGQDCLNTFYVIVMQISLNSLFLLVIGTVGFYTWKYVDVHMNNIDTPTTMMMSLTLTIVVLLGPIFFSWIVQFEDYESPRYALYMTLIRTFTLDGVVIAIVLAYRISKSAKTECWETSLGQEIYRLVLLDFIFGLIGTAAAELIRYRIFKNMWQGIGCPEFDIARNTMNLIYNQTLFYVGLYFSPVLSLVIIFKMFITFYIKKWGAIYNCKPSAKPWRAAQTHTVFLTITFLAFFGVIVLYGYILTSIFTSSCGPFRGKKLMYQSVLNEILVGHETSWILHILLYVFRPGIVAVVLMAMLLAVYYLRSVAKARQHVVNILQDIVRLQAEDKKFLLQSISKFSERNFRDGTNENRFGDLKYRVVQSHFENRNYDHRKPENSDEEQDLYERILKEGKKWKSTADQINDLSKSDKEFKKFGRLSGQFRSGLFRSTQNINSYDNNAVNSNKKLYQSAHNVYDDFTNTDLGHGSHQASTSKLMDTYDQRSLNEYPSYTIHEASSNNYGYQNDDDISQDGYKQDTKINFNPVYTESRSFHSGDEDEGESDEYEHRSFNLRRNGFDQSRSDRSNHEDDPNSRYTPHSYDDRVPSRISFDSNRTNTSSKRY